MVGSVLLWPLLFRGFDPWSLVNIPLGIGVFLHRRWGFVWTRGLSIFGLAGMAFIFLNLITGSVNLAILTWLAYQSITPMAWCFLAIWRLKTKVFLVP